MRSDTLNSELLAREPSPRLSYLAGFAVVLLIFITPFGSESTAGWAIFLHRLLLFGIVATCLISLWNRETLDFGVGIYALAGVSLLIMFFAVWGSNRNIFDGFHLWYHHLLFALFFFSIARFNRTQSIRWKSAILGSVATVIVVHLGWSLLTQVMPLSGPFVNPNYFGSYLLVGFSISLATAARHPSIRWRILGALGAAFLLFGITQSLSRGALIAALGVTALALYKMNRRIQVVALIGLVVLVAGFSPLLLGKFADLGNFDPYNYMRPQIWMSTLNMIGEHPVTGVGMNAYEDEASRFPVAAEGTVGRYARRHKMAHSEYLQYAAEIGIPGALLFVSLLAYFFLSMARARSRPPESEAFLREAGFLAAAGVGAHALVDNNFSVPVVAAVLTVVSLAPLPLPRYSSIRFPSSLEGRTALALVLIGMFTHSTLVPSLATYFNESGQRAFQNEQFDDAERAHRRSVALAPDHPLLLTNLGTMYLDRFARTQDLHWLDAADAFFARAVALNPEFIVARRQRHAVLTRKLNGGVFETEELLSQLMENSREILTVDPVSVFVRRNLAEALNSSGRRDEAIAELTRAIELEPNFVPAYRRLAEWHEEANDLVRSRALGQEADRRLAEFRDTEEMNGYELDLLGLGEQAEQARLGEE